MEGIPLRILIVDDDKRLLSGLKGVLSEEGHHVITSSDGLEALKKCREEEFDLVITDLMLPGAGGMDVLRETKRTRPKTLVVLITGFASLESAIQAIREGAYDYLTKPFKLEEIKVMVSNAQERIRLSLENQHLIHELQEAYNQLRMVKRIMGAEREPIPEASEAEQDAKPNGTFIAGSLLPLYYVEHSPGIQSTLLSELERISSLREKGFLTEEEFSLCKSKLMRNL